MLHPRSFQRGFSILEFALVLPVFLFLLLAAVDITTVLQTRSALKEAVSTSLRCVYPTDGSCNAVNGAAPERLYDFFKPRDGVTPLYPHEEIDFGGELRYLRLPVRELRDFRAPMLRRAHFSIPWYTYTIPNRLEIEQDFLFLAPERALPYVSGASPRSPSFSTPRRSGGDERLPRMSLSQVGRRELSIAAGETGATPSAQVATLRMTLPNTAPANLLDRGCFATHPLTRAPLGSSVRHTLCESLHGRNGTPKVGLVIHVKGSSSGTDLNACGKALLFFNGRPLGGQVFRGPSANANFFPRGVPWHEDVNDEANHWRSPLHGYKYLEYELWQSVDIDLNAAPAGLSISLQRETSLDGVPCSVGPVRWTFEEVDIYSETVAERSGTETCRDQFELPSTTDEVNNFECVAGSPHRIWKRRLGDVPPPSPRYVAGQPSHVNHLAISAQHAALLEQYDPGTPQFADSVTAAVRGPEVPGPEVSSPCLLPSGIETESAQFAQHSMVVPYATTNGFHEPQGHVRAHLMGLCAPRLETVTPFTQYSQLLSPEFPPIDVRNIRWSETAPMPVNTAPISWQFTSCQQPNARFEDLPAALQLFPESKLTFSEHDTGSYALHLGRESTGQPAYDPMDPVNIRANDPRYNCSAVTVDRIVYDDSNPAIDRRSLFVGRHDNVHLCNSHEILRAEAQSSRVPDELRVPANGFFISDTTRRFRAISEFQPSNSCTRWEVSLDQQTSSLEIVPGGPFPEGIVPAACQDPLSGCTRQFAGFQGADPDEEILTDYARAARLGESALYAALPWAERICPNGRRCGTLAVELVDSAHGIVRSSAEADVRLNVLLGKRVMLQHAAEHQREADLALR